MRTPSLSLGIGLGLASLGFMAPAALSADSLSGAVELTSASAACPAGLPAPGTPVTVQFLMPDVIGPGAHQAVRVSLSGEFRDVAVQGCTIGFSGGSADALTRVSANKGVIAQERGCRGYCGL